MKKNHAQENRLIDYQQDCAAKKVLAAGIMTTETSSTTPPTTHVDKSTREALDENGFTQEEANELLRRIKDVETGRVAYHPLVEE